MSDALAEALRRLDAAKRDYDDLDDIGSRDSLFDTIADCRAALAAYDAAPGASGFEAGLNAAAEWHDEREADEMALSAKYRGGSNPWFSHIQTAKIHNVSAKAIRAIIPVASAHTNDKDDDAAQQADHGEALLPCPFCGGEAERIALEDEANFGGDVICCTKCDASSAVEFGRKENLVSNWNRRAAYDAKREAALKQLADLGQAWDAAPGPADEGTPETRDYIRGWNDAMRTSHKLVQIDPPAASPLPDAPDAE